MVCGLLRRFWHGLQKWFQEPPLRKRGSTTSSTDRLQAGFDLNKEKDAVRKRFNTWKEKSNQYEWSNYAFDADSTIANQKFEAETIVIYSDASHFSSLTKEELAEIEEQVNSLNKAKMTKGERKQRLDQIRQPERRKNRTAIGIYMGEWHPLELGMQIGQRNNSFKGECVAIAVALQRLYCWPEYAGQKVTLRTDCLWAISALKNLAAKKPLPTFTTKDGVYELNQEDQNNLSYIYYVARNFPEGVILQFVRSHTKKPDRALDKADKLAKDANKSDREQLSSKHDDKEMMKWDKERHEHIIKEAPNARRNWGWITEQKMTAVKKNAHLLDNFCTLNESGKNVPIISEITTLLRNKQSELFETLDI